MASPTRPALVGEKFLDNHASILEQASDMVFTEEELGEMTPYVPCTDLIIGIDRRPDEEWLQDFFEKLETNKIGSLSLGNTENFAYH